MKKFVYIIILIVFSLFISGCATKRKSQYNNVSRNLMMQDTKELDRNKGYYNSKHIKQVKKNYNKNMKKYRK